MNETIDTMSHMPQTCIFSVTWLAGDMKEPTHLSKRVGHVVSGEFHLIFHAWVGWVSEIKYAMIAAARGAFTSSRWISLNRTVSRHETYVRYINTDIHSFNFIAALRKITKNEPFTCIW